MRRPATAFVSHVLSTDELMVQVVPALGGRLMELTDLRHGRQWLWRNHRVALGPAALGDDYDSAWQGGFEELFPNDAPTTLQSLRLPDHGELWSAAWDVDAVTPESMSLSTTGGVTGATVAKRVELDGSSMRIHYELTNNRTAPLPHLFKLHPALKIDQNCRIDLPGGRVEKVAPDFGNLLSSTEETDWPTPADLSECRSESSKTNEFIYVSAMPEGRCGIVDERVGSRIDFRYPDRVFPYCWIFMTYGGWRNHNVVVLEPCTNYPKDLPAAIEAGTSGVLGAGETLEFDVTVTVGSTDG